MSNQNPQPGINYSTRIGTGTVYGPTVVGSQVPASSIVPLAPPMSAAASICNSHASPTMQLSSGQGEKYIVEYIIVPSEGPCLELCEESRISPREMIGICKFLGLVQVAITTSGHGFVLYWTELIEELGIDKHFSPGLASPEDYKSHDEILYIFLYDPKP